MSILERAIGFLASPQCITCGLEGSAFCEACATAEIMPFGERCWRCGAMTIRGRTCVSCQSFGGPRYVWITTDYDGVASRLVRAYKFGHQRFISETLAELMAATLLRYNSDEHLARANYLVVPVPTATRRVRDRGFDHTKLLAQVFARYQKLDFAQALGRLGQISQIGSHRSDRLTQNKDNYFLGRPDLVIGQNILLIDDVVTTGATIQAATKILRKAGAKHVDALVFAKKL